MNAKTLYGMTALVALLAPVASNAVTINFDSQPTDITYLASGLLLGSSAGPNAYIVGDCGSGDVGCLGDSTSGAEYTGVLDFTFVLPNTTTQAITDMVSFIMCRGCAGQPKTTATVLDQFGATLTVLDMSNARSDIDPNTFTYSFSAPNIGKVVVDLAVDAVESITFGAVRAAVPEPATLALLGLGLAGLGFSRRRSH